MFRSLQAPWRKPGAPALPRQAGEGDEAFQGTGPIAAWLDTLFERDPVIFQTLDQEARGLTATLLDELIWR